MRKIIWQHIRRSPYQAILAILTMFITFFLSGTILTVMFASVFILEYFESKPQITVFLTDKAGDKEAQEIKFKLEETGKVANIKYVSKSEALTIYQKQYKNDPLLLEMVSADILPASLEVTATTPQYLKELEPVVKEFTAVEEVVYQQDVVEALVSWTNVIRYAGGALAILFGLNAFLTVMTIIAMKIALKKEEVEILKLLGASEWYIRFPFFVEGGFYGVVGAFFAGVTIVSLVIWFRAAILDFLGIIPAVTALISDPTATLFLMVAGGFVLLLMAVGFLLGSIGSLVALARYLKI